VVIEDIGTVAKTLPTFAELWTGMLEQSRDQGRTA
jgi:3-phosphoshikimate 1-carboxyvinyltransferase